MTSKDFVASYFEAWNQHDAGGVAQHLSQSGEYFDIPVQQHWNREEFVTHLKDFFAQDKNRYSLVGEVLSGKNTIAFQYLASPVDEADTTPGWMGAEFITMEGDTAGKIEDYYQDADAMQASLGGRKGIVTQRYAKSGLDEEGLRRVMDRVAGLMQDQQMYLDSNLSLPQLATELNCSVNHLSQAINAGFGMSFFDYVNQYRVKAAEQLLAIPDGTNSAILDVALSVGFNSTSTFYAAFKKSTGQTPAQYRRSRKQ
jgi:AraC-like DNA-binding protein